MRLFPGMAGSHGAGASLVEPFPAVGRPSAPISVPFAVRPFCSYSRKGRYVGNAPRAIVVAKRRSKTAKPATRRRSQVPAKPRVGDGPGGRAIDLGPFAGITTTSASVLFEPPSGVVLECRLDQVADKGFFVDLVDWAQWIESHKDEIWASLSRHYSERQLPESLSLSLRLIVPRLDPALEARIAALRYPIEVNIGSDAGGSLESRQSSRQLPGRTQAKFNHSGASVLLRRDVGAARVPDAFINQRIDTLWGMLLQTVSGYSSTPPSGGYDWCHDIEVSAIRAYALLVTIVSNLTLLQVTRASPDHSRTTAVEGRVDEMLDVALAALRDFVKHWPFRVPLDWDGSTRLAFPPRASELVKKFTDSITLETGFPPKPWRTPVPTDYCSLVEAMAYPVAVTASDMQMTRRSAFEIDEDPNAVLIAQANFGVALANSLVELFDTPAIEEPRHPHDVEYLQQAAMRVACANRTFIECVGISPAQRERIPDVMRLAMVVALERGMRSTPTRGLVGESLRKEKGHAAFGLLLGKAGDRCRSVAGVRMAQKMLTDLSRVITSIIEPSAPWRE